VFSVIFDMDGTLLDTQKISIPAWNYAGQIQGFNNMGSPLKYVCGMNEVSCAKYIMANFKSIDILKFRDDVKKYVAENLVVRYKDGVKELLDFLIKNGIKIGLATGTARPIVLSHLEKVNATGYFSAIVCGDEIENGKPAPDIFLKTANLLGENPQNCFVFEDSPNGIKAADNAGMKCFGIPDTAEFDDEIRGLMFKELSSADKAIEILKNYL